ncbi:hypothetical protein BKA61DRAFT_709687 [Leptodontidium sp. MPI-SDFR-AT-0119]|nr:hypothetical protein BKA61DRAFT_709687 [Leptodontidium sp. MPI-SDFR-AT-0119]
MAPKASSKAAKASQAKPRASAPSRRALRSVIQSNSRLEDDHPTQTMQADDSAKTGFLSLPLEIRDMIYRMVIVKEHPVRTISTLNPRSNHIRTSNSIIYVNKQISAEALPILYSVQTFEFTNGTRPPDTDAMVLGSFIGTTRSHLVASITSMKMTACLRMGYDSSKYTNGLYYLTSGNSSYASSFREMCQHMTKNMTNLRSLTIHFGPQGSSIHALRLFSRTATVSGFATSIRILMKLAKLKQLTLVDINVDGFDLLLDKILSDERAAGRVVKFTKLPASVPHLPPTSTGFHVVTEKPTQYLLSR